LGQTEEVRLKTKTESSLRHAVLNNRKDSGNAQNCDNYINISASQPYRSVYLLQNRPSAWPYEHGDERYACIYKVIAVIAERLSSWKEPFL
jgi:hypothetical protein